MKKILSIMVLGIATFITVYESLMAIYACLGVGHLVLCMFGVALWLIYLVLTTKW